MSGRDDLPASRLPACRITDRHLVYDGFVTLEVAVIDTTVHGEPVTLRREVHDHGNGAAVLAYDARAKTAILVRQVRAAVLVGGGDGITLEAIAGLVDGGDDPADTARREAMEEAGIRLKSLEPVGAPYVTPGSVTERIWLFLAEIDDGDGRERGGGLADEHEEIEVLEVPLATLGAMADRGEIDDLKTFLLVERLRRLRPELFD